MDISVSGITSLDSYMSWEALSGLTNLEEADTSTPRTLSGLSILPSFTGITREEVILLSTPPSYLYTTDSSVQVIHHHEESSGQSKFIFTLNFW